MTMKYKPHHPDHYPVGWNTAARLAAEPAKRNGDDPWVSVDWAKGEHSAVGRMKRLRAFREGLYSNRFSYPEVAKAIAEGFELSFRKLEVRGVWDVQLCWKVKGPAAGVAAAVRVLEGEE